jgi:hypothetical protein
MKKTPLLLIVAVAILLCVSCQKEPEEITNVISAIESTDMTIEDSTTKKQLRLRSYNHTAELVIWTKSANETTFEREPDVIFKGTYKTDFYETLDSESKTSIVHTKRYCGIVDFTTFVVADGTSNIVKSGYEAQLDLYSGAFEVEYVAYYKTEKNKMGGTTISYGHDGAGKQIVNLIVNQHPDYETNQSLLISNGWKNIPAGYEYYPQP